MVEGTSLLRKHMGLNLYRGFESLGLRQVINKMPADFSGHFALELCTALYLQTSCVGFEGFRLYADLRPAGYRRSYFIQH